MLKYVWETTKGPSGVYKSIVNCVLLAGIGKKIIQLINSFIVCLWINEKWIVTYSLTDKSKVNATGGRARDEIITEPAQVILFPILTLPCLGWPHSPSLSLPKSSLSFKDQLRPLFLLEAILDVSRLYCPVLNTRVNNRCHSLELNDVCKLFTAVCDFPTKF